MVEKFINIKYGEKEYKAYFNLNVIEAIQEEYGSTEAWGKLTEGGNGKEPNVKALIFTIKEMINEGIDIENDKTGENVPFISLKQAGRIIGAMGMEKFAQEMNELVIETSKVNKGKN